MRLLDLPAEVLVLALRLGLVVVLYLFLLGLFLLARRELGRDAYGRRSAPGRLLVMDAGQTSLPVGEALALLPVTTVGRAHGCTLALDDSFVSATHAVLSWHDDGWWVRDAGSTNGTLLNDQPVPQVETPLTYGDVITIGTARLRLAP